MAQLEAAGCARLFLRFAVASMDASSRLITRRLDVVSKAQTWLLRVIANSRSRKGAPAFNRRGRHVRRCSHPHRKRCTRGKMLLTHARSFNGLLVGRPQKMPGIVPALTAG